MTVTIKAPVIEEHKTFVSYKKRPNTKFLVVHCSATQPKASFTWKTIDQMHRQQGWLGIGYHFVICTDGTIQQGRPLECHFFHSIHMFNMEMIKTGPTEIFHLTLSLQL